MQLISPSLIPHQVNSAGQQAPSVALKIIRDLERKTVDCRNRMGPIANEPLYSGPIDYESIKEKSAGTPHQHR